jgi:hypothetical protein
LKNNEIEDFTVQYAATVDNNYKKAIRLPLKEGYATHDVHKLVIRSDYGHKNRQQDKLKHINIELLNTHGYKVNRDDEMSFVEQNFDIPSYERAIHYVFMQVERYNPLIGASYWISPFGVHENRVKELDRLWKESQLSTPLCILARNVNISILTKTENIPGKDVLDGEFTEIVKTEIIKCKEAEKGESGNILLVELNPPTDYIWYPFPLFKPDENALARFFKIGEINEDRHIGLNLEKVMNEDKTSGIS